jgi:putative DNA primase/helicase
VSTEHIEDEWLELAREILADVVDIYSDTDDGNALRLIAQHGDRFRHVADMGKWHHWNGWRWALDHNDREIRETTKALARALPETSKPAKTFKHYSLAASGVSSALRLAATDPRISILANELDSHPELLNCPNGIVNLRTGELLKHDPALLLSRVTLHEVEIDGTHMLWDRFLVETFGGDQELISYIKRLFGLAVLGNVTEHVLPFLHGVGANGKGVLTLVLQGLLGDADAGGYAVSAPDGFLMGGREGKHETEMARLRGARLVVCSEQTSGKRFDEAKVKRLTGGDRLTGRFMRGDFFDFEPSHLVWCLSNHLPEVKEGGQSFWRRVRRIPFAHVVPEGQRDPELHNRLLAAEGSAILGWAVQGAVEVLARGLQDPASVVAATEEYELSEDTLASFVKDRCTRNPHHWITMADFRDAYLRYCDDAGIDHDSRLSTKAIGSKLRAEFKVTEGKVSVPRQMKTYKGIGLAAVDAQED